MHHSSTVFWCQYSWPIHCCPFPDSTPTPALTLLASSVRVRRNDVEHERRQRRAAYTGMIECVCECDRGWFWRYNCVDQLPNSWETREDEWFMRGVGPARQRAWFNRSQLQTWESFNFIHSPRYLHGTRTFPPNVVPNISLANCLINMENWNEKCDWKIWSAIGKTINSHFDIFGAKSTA